MPLAAQKLASMHQDTSNSSYGCLEDFEIPLRLQDEFGHAPASQSN